MNRAKVIYSLVVVVLFAGMVFFALRCAASLSEVREAKALLERERTNSQMLDFTAMFIDKVVQSKEEVDFETRLALENKVRELNNQAVFDQWNKFTASKTEAAAQVEVKKLLLLLLSEAKNK